MVQASDSPYRVRTLSPGARAHFLYAPPAPLGGGPTPPSYRPCPREGRLAKDEGGASPRNRDETLLRRPHLAAGWPHHPSAGHRLSGRGAVTVVRRNRAGAKLTEWSLSDSESPAWAPAGYFGVGP